MTLECVFAAHAELQSAKRATPRANSAAPYFRAATGTATTDLLLLQWLNLCRYGANLARLSAMTFITTWCSQLVLWVLCHSLIRAKSRSFLGDSDCFGTHADLEGHCLNYVLRWWPTPTFLLANCSALDSCFLCAKHAHSNFNFFWWQWLLCHQGLYKILARVQVSNT